MGHYIKKIIKEDTNLMPAIFSLAGNPNFAQFVSLHDNSEQAGKVDVRLIIKDSAVSLSKTMIKVKETSTSTLHTIEGTKNENYVNNTTFFLADNVATIAENIRVCLMKNSFMKNNFEITIPLEKSNNVVVSGRTIHIVSKSVGTQYSFSLENIDPNLMSVIEKPSTEGNKDTILGDSDKCEIELDMYHSTGLFPGEEDNLALGTYVTGLSKAYFGKPLWFDVNAIAADRKGYSVDFLNNTGWCDAGTASDYRFVAKRFDGTNHEAFYMSDVFYTINGRDRILEKNDLSDYVYKLHEGNIIKPLTSQPALTHIEGQSQFFNFILSNPDKHKGSGQNNKIGILYEVYSQSGNYIKEELLNEIAPNELSVVNTIRLDIDEVVKRYSNAGLIKTYLMHKGKKVSKPLVFNLLPSCLYELREFAFLNSLGGWSSFNFGGVRQSEFKANNSTIFKAHQPSFGKSSDIESVIRKDIEEQFVVETIPVDAVAAEWLRDMSGALAVYELASQRYIVVDDLIVKVNSKDDLFTLQMKYHYSDSYNAVS